MLKQMKKTLGILLAVCFLMSVTAAAASADRGEHGGHGDFAHGEHGNGWGWGNDHSHRHWWHGQYYPNCDWVLNPYTNQWIWTC